MVIQYARLSGIIRLIIASIPIHVVIVGLVTYCCVFILFLPHFQVHVDRLRKYIFRSGVEVTVTLPRIGNMQVYPEMEGRMIELGRTREGRDSGKRSLMRWDRRD